jgi:Bardet-Biedl syndrome 1 protein
MCFLQVWKGTVKASEHTLLDDPVAITSFIADRSQPRVPTLAVAAGPHIYMFKNMRPYYKFTLPHNNANAEEDVIW